MEEAASFPVEGCFLAFASFVGNTLCTYFGDIIGY